MAETRPTDTDKQSGEQTDALNESAFNTAALSDDDSVYADADHWMHSVSADDTDVAESGRKINLNDLNLSAIAEEPTLPDRALRTHSAAS